MSTTKTVTSVPTIRCLVIQLARLGDTLQSMMALRAAQQLYPQLEIHFLAREKFASAAKKVPWLKSVITLPTDTLLEPILSGKKPESEGIREIAHWLRPLISDPWDMVINWSFSEASSYLTALIPARVKYGYSRRSDTSFSGTDGWSHYMQAVVQGGVSQNIHLTDILTTQLLTALQIHAGDPLSDGNSAATSKSFFALTLTEEEVKRSSGDMSKKWIAIQLGAGSSAKSWDPLHWAKLAQIIIKRHPGWGIYLLGGKEDQEKAETIIREVSPYLKKSTQLISLVGETNFDLWASVVSRSQWLFSCDTAAIHLASVLGTRILNISIGPVNFLETGPYGNGHYVVTSNVPCEGCTQRNSKNHTCKNDVTPEAAYVTWSYGSNEWAHRRQIALDNHFSQFGWSDKIPNIRIYRSKIRQGADGGGVSYEPLLRHPTTLTEWSSMVMGHVARSWYCGWVPTTGQELNRESLGPQLIQKLRELKDSIEVLTKICDQASRAALSLHRKSTSLKSKKLMGVRDREEIQELGNALAEMDSLVDRLAATHPTLLGFSQMSKVLMHHLKGNDLAALGQETSQCYRQLGEGVQIFRNWIKATLDMVRPVMIPKSNVTSIETLQNKSEKEINP